MRYRTLQSLDRNLISCSACPRLVEWREQVAMTKRKAYQDQEYWGLPVPGFGVENPRILIVGLAPGAHGANRTGRIFTGDSSGDWLYRSLHKNSLASIPTSTDREDGQQLFDTRITCVVHCAPPENKPSIQERDACSTWFTNELHLTYPSLRVIVALGAFAWNSVVRSIRSIKDEYGVEEFIDSQGAIERSPRFSHGAQLEWKSGDGNSRVLLGSYHPSQQNTFTGKLTEAMLDQVFARASRFGV